MRLKLISSFIGLALCALLLAALALFESYDKTATDIEYQHLQQLLDLLEYDELTVKNFSADYILAKYTNDSGLTYIANPENIQIDFTQATLDHPASHKVEFEQAPYIWATRSFAKDSAHIILFRKLSNADITSFYTHFGTEFIIFTIFTIWSVMWVALVVNSLLSKVNNQKLQLEKEHQKALYETQAKSKFLANISHEIRTPLSAIIGYSETLLHSDQPMTERLGSINTIIRNGNHMLTLVNDLLDLSKIEAGKLEVEAIEVRFIALLQDIEQLFQHQCKRKGIEFKLKLHFPLPEIINSDPVRLKQILINLCSNAIKFTKNGYVHIDVQLLNSHKLQLKIEDSGVGMTEEQQKKLFQDYTQADSTTSRKYGGTGLGLSLSKRLSILLGGDITVSSHAGRGSVFTLSINADIPENSRLLANLEEIAPEIHAENILTERMLEGKVLIAEDNQDNQQLFSMYLQKFGIIPDLAHNGQQAIEFALHKDYDLIFMDMQMPIMDGIEATQSLHEKGIHTPIIALTANAMRDDMERFYAAGCDAFLTKPLKREQLYKTCQQYLRYQQANDILQPLYSTVLIEEPEFIDIVLRFAHRLREIHAHLSSLTQQNQFDELARQAHDLKGVSGNMGYQELSTLVGKLEFQIANKNSQEIGTLLGQMATMLERIEMGLQ